MKWKWIWTYFVNYIDITNLMFYRGNKEATRLLKEEIELAKLYPQYVLRYDNYTILLNQHTFWTANRYYSYGYSCYTKYKVSCIHKYFDKDRLYCYESDYNEKKLPSMHMRIQLAIFIEDYLAGKYNNIRR